MRESGNGVAYIYEHDEDYASLLSLFERELRDADDLLTNPDDRSVSVMRGDLTMSGMSLDFAPKPGGQEWEWIDQRSVVITREGGPHNAPCTILLVLSEEDAARLHGKIEGILAARRDRAQAVMKRAKEEAAARHHVELMANLDYLRDVAKIRT